MSALNRHSIAISGLTFRELSERAAAIFDAFFDREIAWQVTRFDTEAHLTELKNGVGEITHSEVTSWTAVIEAEADDLYIGVAKGQEAALLFKPLGT